MTSTTDAPTRRGITLRVASGVVGLLAVVVAASAGWITIRLRASLPRLEGEVALAGLDGVVRIERDEHSVPVVRGTSRLDVARATGFLHAQERFFQMDLLRRRAAGELAELVGSGALDVDRGVRVFRLRAVARRAVASLRTERALLEAYTAGVNAGLEALGGVPFEYVLLRASPRAWETEDSMLCALAMFVTLQGRAPEDESRLGALHDLLPPELFAFLAPLGTEWDAPLEGEAYFQHPVPGPDVLDLRTRAPRVDTRGRAKSGGPWASFLPADAIVPGSNNWAVAGAHTVHGGALLANDMHLGLSVPNTWYRASLVFPTTAGGERRVTGVMLPGAPFVVAGSNGRVAWGFTNSQGDWADLVVLEPDGTDDYRTPDGSLPFERTIETIRVRDGEDETLEVRSTVFGPVVDSDHLGRPRALAWVALREGGLNGALVRMEGVDDVEGALALAPLVGIPNQNLVCADADGHIGWTIVGRIPRRRGFDGRLPTSWSDGSRRWDGWLAPDEYPRVVDPPAGRIWTANARVVDGAALAAVGFGSYELGARARQIRDDLRSLEHASEADMLAVQLDDRAQFLERWRRLLLDTLAPKAVTAPGRLEARRLVEAWGGRAAVESTGYRIVRRFREEVARRALSPLTAAASEADAGSGKTDALSALGHKEGEGPLWALVTERPPHLLDPRFGGWDELLLEAVDSTLAELLRGGEDLARRTWGEQNMTRIQHPLSPALPALGRWLDMPREQLPGDSHMPRVQHPSAGASERLVVSPGREDRGYFHMPGGQSGHPLSAHYADGHAAWAEGAPTPFLPGPAVFVLTLRPTHAGPE